MLLFNWAYFIGVKSEISMKFRLATFFRTIRSRYQTKIEEREDKCKEDTQLTQNS